MRIVHVDDGAKQICLFLRFVVCLPGELGQLRCSFFNSSSSSSGCSLLSPRSTWGFPPPEKQADPFLLDLEVTWETLWILGLEETWTPIFRVSSIGLSSTGPAASLDLLISRWPPWGLVWLSRESNGASKKIYIFILSNNFYLSWQHTLQKPRVAAWSPILVVVWPLQVIKPCGRLKTHRKKNFMINNSCRNCINDLIREEIS